MAFAGLTSEIEELISKCEFQNKQLVRAINQENQLAASINYEIDMKKKEKERFEEQITQMLEETQYHDKQLKRNKDNVENLKRTSDVLTEHVHAIQTQFEDMKIKRHDEKCVHDQQLQHFKDVWTKYKQTYEKYPLAIHLRKIEIQIQANEKYFHEKALESQEVKKAIEDIEKANYWRKMDWKTFCIKLAENRVHVLKLREEIGKKKKAIVTLNTQQHNEEEMQISGPAVDKHVPKTRSSEMGRSDDDMDISPMISVFTERENVETEVMQTDQVEGNTSNENEQIQRQVSGPSDGNQECYPCPAPKPNQQSHANSHYAMGIQQIKTSPHTYQQNQSNDSSQSNMRILEGNNRIVTQHNEHSHYDIQMSERNNRTAQQQYQPDQAFHNSHYMEMPPSTSRENQVNQAPNNHNHIQPSQKDQSTSLPYASYKRTGQQDGSYKEKVDLHLTVTQSPPNMQNVPPPSSTNPMRSQSEVSCRANSIPAPTEVCMPTRANTIPAPTTSRSWRETSVINTHQNNESTQKPLMNRIPIRGDQVSAVTTPSRTSCPITAPTLSPREGTGNQLNVIMKPRQPPTRPSIQVPTMNRPVPRSKQLTIPSVQIPKISLNPMASPRQPMMISRSPMINVPRVPNVVNSSRPYQQHKPPVSSQNQQEYTSQKGLQDNNTSSMSTNPEMLQVQTSKITKTFTPQPSPCPFRQPGVPNESASDKRQQDQTPSPQSGLHNLTSQKQIDNNRALQECQDTNMGSPQKMPEPNSPSKSMLQGNVYYVPLKESPQKSTNPPRKHPITSTEGQGDGNTSLSPFNYEKHRQRLAELKKSPGYEQYAASRRMFEASVGEGVDRTETPSKQPVYTSVFGGARQPPVDKSYTASPVPDTDRNYNIFSFGNSPGNGTSSSTFTMFGEENNVDKQGDCDGFQLNFGDKDTADPSSGTFSLFDNTAMDTSPTTFSFNFNGGDGTDAPAEGKALSLFGNSTDEDRPSASGDFNFNDLPYSANVLSLFGEPSTEDRPTAGGDFKFNLRKGGYGSPAMGTALSLFGDKSNADESTSDGNFSFSFRKGDVNESPEGMSVLSLFGDSKD